MIVWEGEDRSAAAIICVNDGRIELSSTRRLPYDPSGVLREARARLRSELRQLVPHSQELFEGRYISAITGFVDTENVVFYNVGISGSTCEFGLQFVRDFTPPTEVCGVRQRFDHSQSYSLTARQVVCDHSSCAASVHFGLPQLSVSLKAAHYWLSAKQSLVHTVHENTDIAGPFKMTVIISGPFFRANVASIIKPLFDGIISALHFDCITLGEDPGYAKFATKLPDASADILYLLRNPINAALGERKLLTSNGQLNPADDLCLIGQLLIENKQTVGWSVDAFLSPLSSVCQRESPPSQPL